MRTLEETAATRAVLGGAGYIELEMAEALVARGLVVAQIEQLPEVLPTVDPELGGLVHDQLVQHGVEVQRRTRVTSIMRAPAGAPGRLAPLSVTRSARRPSSTASLLSPSNRVSRPRLARGKQAATSDVIMGMARAVSAHCQRARLSGSADSNRGPLVPQTSTLTI